MPAEVVTGAEPKPRRARYLLPRGLPRRGELLAGARGKNRHPQNHGNSHDGESYNEPGDGGQMPGEAA